MKHPSDWTDTQRKRFLILGGLLLVAALLLVGWLVGVMIWLSCSAWFTELGLTAVLPWQETIAVGLNLLLLGGGAILVLRRFSRKDVA